MKDIKQELENYIKTQEKGSSQAYEECKKIIYKYQDCGLFTTDIEYLELIDFICDKLEY